MLNEAVQLVPIKSRDVVKGWHTRHGTDVGQRGEET